MVNAFITSWIANGLGAPGEVRVDNGGELDNPLNLEAMEQYNIEVRATGAHLLGLMGHVREITE